MEKGLIEYFLALVGLESESLNERLIMDRLKTDLSSLGFTVEEDNANLKTGGNAGNLYAWLPGNLEMEPLLFCAHVDTVRPGRNIKPQITEDKITSDHTTVLGSDDKSGVAQIIWGIKEYLQSNQQHPPLEILFTISEEIGLLGACFFDKTMLKSKLGFAFDSEDINEVMIAAPSQNIINITIYGKEAHAGVEPEKGINAIRVASEAISAIPLGRLDEETTSNIGIIEGGIATNIVPNKVVIKGEARSHDAVKLAQVTDKIVQTFEETAARHKLGEHSAKAEIDVHDEYHAFCLEPSHPAVKVVKAAMERLYISPHFVKGGGGSDANIFNAEGIAMPIIGTGMKNCHTVDEYILLKDLETGARLVQELIKVYTEGAF
ncbi:MAG: M20/M25/M40 family metallo-hydrolase [Candidatus Cloacimonadaceae bacterium]